MGNTYPPVKNEPFDLYFDIPKDDGTRILNPTALAANVVLDGRRLVRAPAVRVVDTTTGSCVARLEAYHTNGDIFYFSATATDAGALPYTERVHTAAQSLNTMHSRTARRRGWR